MGGKKERKRAQAGKEVGEEAELKGKKTRQWKETQEKKVKSKRKRLPDRNISQRKEEERTPRKPPKLRRKKMREERKCLVEGSTGKKTRSPNGRK